MPIGHTTNFIHGADILNLLLSNCKAYDSMNVVLLESHTKTRGRNPVPRRIPFNSCNRLLALLAAVASHHAHRAGAHDCLHHLAGALELLDELVDLRE